MYELRSEDVVCRRIMRSTECGFELSSATRNSWRNWRRINRVVASAAYQPYCTWFHCRNWRAVHSDASTKSTRFLYQYITMIKMQKIVNFSMFFQVRRAIERLCHPPCLSSSCASLRNL